MPEQELWLTKLLNDHAAGVANALLGLARFPALQRPWTNWLSMELLVIAILFALVLLARMRLSVDQPVGLHHGERYLPYFGTLFLFIVLMNLIGLVPSLESPTMYIMVPLGLALATFVYYNYHGIRELGLLAYLKQFMGPVAWLAVLMIPLELISHLARILSLSVRLYANMFAGDQVTM